METTLWNWLIQIPLTLGEFASWVVSPINEQYLNISPLGLLGVGGSSFIIALVVIHVVKLFI